MNFSCIVSFDSAEFPWKRNLLERETRHRSSIPTASKKRSYKGCKLFFCCIASWKDAEYKYSVQWQTSNKETANFTNEIISEHFLSPSRIFLITKISFSGTPKQISLPKSNCLHRYLWYFLFLFIVKLNKDICTSMEWIEPISLSSSLKTG